MSLAVCGRKCSQATVGAVKPTLLWIQHHVQIFYIFWEDAQRMSCAAPGGVPHMCSSTPAAHFFPGAGAPGLAAGAAPLPPAPAAAAAGAGGSSSCNTAGDMPQAVASKL